jgi:hypothetical protein
MCPLRLLHLFTPLHRRSVWTIRLSTSPICKLRAADDERRQTKRNRLANKLTVEAKTFADLKIEKAKFDGDKKVVEADLARSGIWRHSSASATRTCCVGSS